MIGACKMADNAGGVVWQPQEIWELQRLQTGCVSQVIYSLTDNDAAILRRASSIAEYLERHIGRGRGDSDINIVGRL